MGGVKTLMAIRELQATSRDARLWLMDTLLRFAHEQRARLAQDTTPQAEERREVIDRAVAVLDTLDV